ncbi:MAG: lytic transglycosylase domain-containing protein [Collinsella intestinalis]|uniref:Lytic transglycosylase domain-containing protein n=1 Tax=Collinsella intestinalis TaxID=147207 RepID=A0A943BKI5_9ACTN|nr:lytic transglycosylase domain-containing protein [Collinsella intestinalis]
MNRRGSFLRWYRVFPLTVVLIFGLVSFAFAFAPSLLFKSMYPLRYEDEITASAASHGVDPYLVAAVIRSESSWDPEASSHQGARGLMQLMPETAQDMVAKGLVDGKRYSYENLEDPTVNIEYGCAYLSYLLTYFNGATDRAIAAYNAGMGNVDGWAKQDKLLHNAITFPETQAYLVRVNMAKARYQELYPQAFR